jgi:hypothetical protein
MRPRGRTILWLVPILVGCTIILLTLVDHSLFQHRFFFPVLIVFGLISPKDWGFVGNLSMYTLRKVSVAISCHCCIHSPWIYLVFL